LDRLAGANEQAAGDESLSMPIGHTTAAQKLLAWPTIKACLSHTDKDYVMKAEEDRGLIRLYRRAEGTDNDDGSIPFGGHRAFSRLWACLSSPLGALRHYNPNPSKSSKPRG
jgi:hypothetical protein